jgi:hypothetical protein
MSRTVVSVWARAGRARTGVMKSNKNNVKNKPIFFMKSSPDLWQLGTIVRRTTDPL